MPGGDRTGPQGMGPLTGRAAGFCAGNEVPGFRSPNFGRGAYFGARRGIQRGIAFRNGRGRGWRWQENVSTENPHDFELRRDNPATIEHQLKQLDAEIAELRELIRAMEHTETDGE